jgi:hypothetical protein
MLDGQQNSFTTNLHDFITETRPHILYCQVALSGENKRGKMLYSMYFLSDTERNKPKSQMLLNTDIEHRFFMRYSVDFGGKIIWGL